MFGNTKRKNSDTEEGELGVNYGHEPIQSRPPKKNGFMERIGSGNTWFGLDCQRDKFAENYFLLFGIPFKSSRLICREAYIVQCT